MFNFINWLRVIAAIFITNSHYANVWPMPAMAFGGQLGNNLFFFVSGFCLFNIHEKFPKWYLKRILRIYPAVWITTIIYMIVSYFYINDFSSFIYYFIYPTGFHFVGSIMVLYIILYLVRVLQAKWNIPTQVFMIIVFTIFIALYLAFCDKSDYHIDSVAEKWVLFMFTESMLMGSYLRSIYEKINKKIKHINWISILLLFAGYFIGKKTFSNYSFIAPLQFLQPIIVIFLTSSIGYLFIKLEKNDMFLKNKKSITRLVLFLSPMTLEIYLSQDIIVSHFINLTFPLSFIVVSSSIVIYAFVVHICSNCIQRVFNKLLKI